MSGRSDAVLGHAPVRHGPGDWRCKCGATLSGGPYGSGRAGARDVMRFHRFDLWHPKANTLAEAVAGRGAADGGDTDG